MLINSWFHFLLATLFFIGFGISGTILSIYFIIGGLRSKKTKVSWKALFTSGPLKDIADGILIFTLLLYGFFGLGMFWDYLEAASLFLESIGLE